MLAWRPGEMTRRYIAGERARFISPVALYLFTVFAMFAVAQLHRRAQPDAARHMQQGLKTGIAEDQQRSPSLKRSGPAALAAGKDVADLDRQIAKNKQDARRHPKGPDRRVASHPPQANDQTPRWIRPFVKNIKDNPDLVSMRVQDAASKYSWLLIPMSVPFMWLLFPFRRRYNTYDHTVFVTYSLSFMMLLVVAGGLLISIGLTSLASLLFFVPPFHMYRHLKQTYELGRFSAIMRTIALDDLRLHRRRSVHGYGRSDRCKLSLLAFSVGRDTSFARHEASRP